MRIVTWNVNSVRARLERVLALLQRHRPDLVCLQETKSVDEGFPRRAMEELGYQVHAYGQKTYNGVALLSRQPLREERRGFDGDPVPHEARVISAQDVTTGELDVINLYVVNGQALGSEKYALKLRWLDALVDWISRTKDPARPLLVVGDFNIAPADIDVHAPELWHDRLLVSAPERARLRRLLDWGLVDLLRQQTQDRVFTWWDYRFGAFRQDLGLRLDLILGTRSVAGRVRAVTVDRNERHKKSGPGAPSDHAPVLVDLE